MNPTSPSPDTPRASRASWHRWWKKTRRRVGSWLLPIFGPTFAAWIAKTWKVEFHLPEGCEDPFERDRGKGRLFALWHGRLLVGTCTHDGRGVSVLVSPSDDGSLVTSLLGRLDFEVIRGSSSRGGARAVREMLRLLDEGRTVVLTPDGPRGPRHSMNPGLAWMARSSGVRVVPVGIVCDRAWYLNSWDAFTVPKPGARVVVEYGELLEIGPGSDEETRTAFTEAVREALMQAEERAFARLGIPTDHHLGRTE